MKERRKTLPPKLKLISKGINDAIQEAKKIRELTVQEEVVLELDKVNATLEEARKQISKIMRLLQPKLVLGPSRKDSQFNTGVGSTRDSEFQLLTIAENEQLGLGIVFPDQERETAHASHNRGIRLR